MSKVNYKSLVENVYSLHASIKSLSPETFIPAMISMESVLGDELTDNLPVGTIKQKITTLLKMAVAKQTQELLLALSILKEEVNKNVPEQPLVYKQDVLKTVKERFNAPLKATEIPPYHQMEESAREAVLKTIQTVFELEELPSIDFANKVIDIYNSGAPKSVVCQNIGLSFVYDKPEMYANEHVRQIITEERVVLYITERLNRTLALVANLDNYNEITPDTLVGILEEFLSTIDIDERKKLVDDALLANTYKSDSDLIKLKELTKATIGSTNHVISIIKEQEPERFQRLNNIEQLEEMFGDSLNVDTAYTISSLYLRVLESVTYTLTTTEVLISVVKEAVDITDTIINDLMKVDQKLDKLYNDIIQLSTPSQDTVSTEGFSDVWQSIKDWFKAGSFGVYLNESSTGRILAQNFTTHKTRVEESIRTKGILDEKQMKRFKKFSDKYFKQFWGINIWSMSDEEVKDLLLNKLADLPNRQCDIDSVNVERYFEPANKMLERSKEIASAIDRLSGEACRLVSDYTRQLNEINQVASKVQLERLIRNILTLSGRELRSLPEAVSLINVFNVKDTTLLETIESNTDQLYRMFEYTDVKKITLSAANALPYLQKYPHIHGVCANSGYYCEVKTSINYFNNEFEKTYSELLAAINAVKENIEAYAATIFDYAPDGVLTRLMLQLDLCATRLDYGRIGRSIEEFYKVMNDRSTSAHKPPSMAVASCIAIYEIYLYLA